MVVNNNSGRRGRYASIMMFVLTKHFGVRFGQLALVNSMREVAYTELKLTKGMEMVLESLSG